MSGSLRLLMLEDNPVDAELNERVLRKAGLQPRIGLSAVSDVLRSKSCRDSLPRWSARSRNRSLSTRPR